jgi:hypothetical protein
MLSQSDADIDAMIAAFDPVTIVWGAFSAQGIRDAWDTEVLQSEGKGVVVGLLALQVRTSAIDGLQIGAEVIVDGATYTVRDRQRPIESADGALTHLLLKKA